MHSSPVPNWPKHSAQNIHSNANCSATAHSRHGARSELVLTNCARCSSFKWIMTDRTKPIQHTSTPSADPADRFKAFVTFVRTHIKGDEKGEAQIFCDRFFQAFGYAGIMEAGG